MISVSCKCKRSHFTDKALVEQCSVDSRELNNVLHLISTKYAKSLIQAHIM